MGEDVGPAQGEKMEGEEKEGREPEVGDRASVMVDSRKARSHAAVLEAISIQYTLTSPFFDLPSDPPHARNCALVLLAIAFSFTRAMVVGRCGNHIPPTQNLMQKIRLQYDCNLTAIS